MYSIGLIWGLKVGDPRNQLVVSDPEVRAGQPSGLSRGGPFQLTPLGALTCFPRGGNLGFRTGIYPEMQPYYSKR